MAQNILIGVVVVLAVIILPVTALAALGAVLIVIFPILLGVWVVCTIVPFYRDQFEQVRGLPRHLRAPAASVPRERVKPRLDAPRAQGRRP